MKVYTRRGDAGETDLFGGGRVPKDHRRVAVYGEVDELNAAVGVAAAATTDEDLRALAERIQRTLFAVGSTLATPDPAHRAKSAIPEAAAGDVEALEQAIDRLEEELPALTNFVLPGGAPAAAGFHLARTICRRAERAAVELARDEDLGSHTLRYLNRLSDLLFVMARSENHRSGRGDVEWRPRDGG